MNTKNAVVGQEAAVAHSGSWSTHYNFGYRVVKVTPSGQVVIRRESDGYERRFDNRGKEMGKSYCSDYLVLDVDAVALDDDQRPVLFQLAQLGVGMEVVPGVGQGGGGQGHRWMLRVVSLEGASPMYSNLSAPPVSAGPAKPGGLRSAKPLGDSEVCSQSSFSDPCKCLVLKEFF
jgi:hypothetical protein